MLSDRNIKVATLVSSLATVAGLVVALLAAGAQGQTPSAIPPNQTQSGRDNVMSGRDTIINPTPSLRRVTPGEAAPLVGSWTGEYSCGRTQGHLEWSIGVVGNRLQVTEHYERRIAFLPVQGNKSYQAVWRPPHLILTDEGAAKYKIDLTLSASGRQLTGEYYEHGRCDAIEMEKVSSDR